MKATGTLFSNLLQGQQHFIVPLFQRPYTWEEKDWKTLFDDVIEVYEEGFEESHFVGSIVTKSLGATPEGVSPFLIIDGQQRLTTVTLLLAALREVAVETAPRLSDKVHRLYLTNEFAPDEHRYKVLPTQADRASYRAVIDGPSEVEATSDRASTPLPRRAYEYFLKRLRVDKVDGEPIDPSRLEQVLIGKLEVVSITLEDADNEYRIFESLNGTGTPLAQADLIRNYFFMRSPVGEHDDLYPGVWLPMQDSLGGAFDLFFRHAYMSDGQFVRGSDVFQAWKTRLDPVLAHELGDRMRHLAAEARNYRRLLAPAEEPDPLVSRGLSRLNRWGGQTSYPFLLNAYRLYESGEVDAREFAEVLGIIESFLVRRMFARVHPGQLNRLFLRLYHQLPEGSSLAEGTRAVLSEPSRRWPRDDTFREAVQQLPFYTDGRAEQRRLVLETIEESYGTKEPVDLSALTIEHVMPQTLTEEWVRELGEFAQERHREMVHRIGNLTLTGYNPELSNSPFHVKRKKLAESNVAMNKEIAREAEWGFAQIEERGSRIAERALALWPGPVPSSGTAFGTGLKAASSSERIGTTGRTTTIKGDELKQQKLSILPRTGSREMCLMAFADAIAEADVHGRDKWAVTHKAGKVRLIVGHLIVCTLEDRPKHGPIWMALDRGLLKTSNYESLLEQSADWEWDIEKYPEYPKIQSRNGYYRPSERHSEIWPAIKQLHFESISKAATETTMDRRTPRGHSPEVLEYLRKGLGRQIPDPPYWRPGRSIEPIYRHSPDRRTGMREILRGLVREEAPLVLDESDKYYIRFIPRAWDRDTLKAGDDWADKWTKTGRILLFEFSNRDTIRLKLVIGPGPEEVRQKLFDMALSGAAFRPSRKVLKRRWNTIFSRVFLKLDREFYEEDSDGEVREKLRQEWTMFLKHDLPRLDASLKQEEWIWEAAEPHE